jgi:hypothetical protein
MAETPTIMWTGKSGVDYKYWIYPIGTEFKEKAGNYIYARRPKPGFWSPVYIGQTGNLDSRLASHEKEECAIEHGATHVHVHLSGDGEDGRCREEKDLILRWQPPCNDHFVQ